MLPTNPLLNATAPAGPHLPVALLRQYAAGTLAPAAQHRVEAHTLACGRCADILEGLLQTPPATTDQALAQLQQRLRQRGQQAAPARLTQRPRRHHWLAPQLATAAALLLALLAAGWWAWQQRQHTLQHTPHAAVPPPAAAPTPSASLEPASKTSDLAAAPIGGQGALRDYLKKEAARFEPMKQAGLRRSGRVLVRLRIGADGKIVQAEAVRKLRADYDAEAIRMLQAGPAWVPGISGGQRVAQTVDIPVEFE